MGICCMAKETEGCVSLRGWDGKGDGKKEFQKGKVIYIYIYIYIYG